MSLYKRQLYLNLKVILTLQVISNINDNWGIRKYNLADNYINLADNRKLVLAKSHEDTSSIYSTTCIHTCYPVLFLATALFFFSPEILGVAAQGSIFLLENKQKWHRKIGFYSQIFNWSSMQFQAIYFTLLFIKVSTPVKWCLFPL